MKQLSVEFKIAALIIVAAAVVGLAGNFSYQSINTIVSALQKEAQPNMSLILIKEINTSIVQAESSIKYYTLTGDYRYLRPYAEVKKSVMEKHAQLRKINLGNEHKLTQIDSIYTLINKKFDIWNSLLAIRNDDRLDNALSKLSIKLDSTQDILTIKVPQNITIVKADTANVQEIIPIKPEDDKDGFFARIFKKKEVAEPTNNKPDEIPIVQEEIISKDTIIEVGIAPQTIHDEITKIRQEEGQAQQKITAREIRLSKRSDEISVLLNQLISRLENEELEEMAKRAVEANTLAGSTTRLLVIFLVIFSLLLISVFYVIQRYVRKSHATQKALVRAKDEALRLTKAREQFMANISHEIRTPMHAIVGFTEQLEKQIKDQDSKSQVNIIKKSAEHLQGIINDVLDFSKLDSGKFELEKIPFAPHEVIDEIFNLYRGRAEVHQIEYTFHIAEDMPQVLLGDPLRLRQIALNLVSNALKFTSKGFVKVKLSVHAINEDIANLIFVVQDSGIGISKQEQGFIFEEFNQATSSTTRKFGGTGLGLSIVKKLVEVQGGTIQVKSKVKEGSVFEVEIPYHIGEEMVEVAENEVEPMPEILPPLNLIVADDDEYNRGLIAHILSKWNIQYELVEDGKKVVDALNSGKSFDFGLLDIQMPEMNGIEATAYIRGSGKEYSNIPLMALTATIAQEELSKCKEVGFNKIIPKPFKEGVLFKSICDLLKVEIPKQKVSESNSEIIDAQEPELFSNLYHIAGNDERFVFEMLQMFIKTSKEGLKEAANALESKDWITLAENAHKIKSPCKHLDAVELSELLKEIEMVARNNEQKDELYEMVQKAELQINELIIEVENYMASKAVDQ